MARQAHQPVPERSRRERNCEVKMKGYVYILRCANGSYYTGSTTDLEKRIWQHQNGEGANFTKAHLPIELVYVEEFPRIDEAFCREKQIQGWSRKKKEALINGDFDELQKLAKSKGASTGSATDGSTGSATDGSTGSATDGSTGSATDGSTGSPTGH